MADFDEYFRVALLDAVKERGAQARLSRDSGIGTSYINNIIKGRDSGSEGTRRALAAALGFAGRRYEDFLEVGRAISEGRELPLPEPLSLADESLADFFRVPYSDNMRLAPGTGGLIPVTREVEHSPVMIHGPTVGRSNPWGLRAFKVDDEAMSPMISRGDIVLADLKQNDYRRVKNDEIYVICCDFDEGQGLVRQLEWAGREHDRLALKSADGRPAIYRQPREIRILGRVLWAWRCFE
ncbi:S24 family peptidase [Deltaproteobacteria bacterium OttesenSCG-928-K17]|nr:S24 family peptidase [Deltaproteobacteria bacterium OttesenSCG-928-K17]